MTLWVPEPPGSALSCAPSPVSGSRSRKNNINRLVADSREVKRVAQTAGAFQGVTTIFPVIFGWIAQKYSTVPAVENVCEDLSLVSRALE